MPYACRLTIRCAKKYSAILVHYLLPYMLMELSIALVKTLVDNQYSIFAAIDAWLAPSLSVFVLVVLCRFTLQTQRYVIVHLPSIC